MGRHCRCHLRDRCVVSLLDHPQEASRTLLLRTVQDLCRRPKFNHHALIHECDPVGDITGEPHDCMIIEDGAFISDAYQGSPEWYLRNASAVPMSDPLPLVPLLGHVTKSLGIVATIITSLYPPYIAARLGATLDHLMHGRVGLNIVTAHNDRSAPNFGLDRHHEHDLRYEMADEWMEVVNRLWSS